MILAEATATQKDSGVTDISHAFCALCYPAPRTAIVSLCGEAWSGQPIAGPGAVECVVCDSFDRCETCGAIFHRPWGVAS